MWEIQTDRKLAEELEAKYLISNIQVSGDMYDVKFIAKNQPEFKCKEGRATLDDVFLWYFGGKL